MSEEAEKLKSLSKEQLIEVILENNLRYRKLYEEMMLLKVNEMSQYSIKTKQKNDSTNNQNELSTINNLLKKEIENLKTQNSKLTLSVFLEDRRF